MQFNFFDVHLHPLKNQVKRLNKDTLYYRIILSIRFYVPLRTCLTVGISCAYFLWYLCIHNIYSHISFIFFQGLTTTNKIGELCQRFLIAQSRHVQGYTATELKLSWTRTNGKQNGLP